MIQDKRKSKYVGIDCMKQYRSYQYMQYKLARKIKLQLCHWDKRTTHSGHLYTRVTT